jgi:hypothetical protein
MPLIHRIMAGSNPSDLMDFRKRVLSYPLRKLGPSMRPSLEKGTDASIMNQLAAMGVLAYAAAPVFTGNVLFPLKLIEMGFRPRPVLEGISYVKTSLGWPMPVWNMFHGASPAYKAGAKVGGKVGARVGARLIPGIGYGLLAYDVYDLTVNRSLWGFDL